MRSRQKRPPRRQGLHRRGWSKQKLCFSKQIGVLLRRGIIVPATKNVGSERDESHVGGHFGRTRPVSGQAGLP